MSDKEISVQDVVRLFVDQAKKEKRLYIRAELIQDFTKMNDEEIARMKEDVEKEQQEQMQQQAADSQMQAQAQAQGETEGTIAGGGGAPPGASTQAAESKNLDNLGKLLEYTTDDNKKKVLERIINKQSSKIKIDN